MEYPTVADMSLNSSPTTTSGGTPSSDRDHGAVHFLSDFNSAPSDEESPDFENEFIRHGVVDSPVHKRHLFPAKEFVAELRPEEIRWFHRSDGSKKWVNFIGYDSLRIECRYRALAVDTNGDLDKDERILVLGGLFEVDVTKKKCFPVYWSGDVSDIVRGIWFYDNFQPLEPVYAKDIEAAHLLNFRGKRLEEAVQPPKGSKPVVHNMKFRDFHVDWNASNEIYMYSESTSSKIMRRVTKSIGWQKSGSRLYRGYCYEAMMDDKPPDITHLVFVIHGIGQKFDSGGIVRCVDDLRDRVDLLQSKLFPKLSSENQRAEFLPVEWRTSLKLDGDTVESITPNKMKGVRSILNSTAMDILYYTSPLYRSEITASLQRELHRLYDMFCSRHPYFAVNGGKVSIVSHSLGSVITFDIITAWNPIQLYDQFVCSIIKEQEKEAKRTSTKESTVLLEELDTAKLRMYELEHTLHHVKEVCRKGARPLPFKVENLFCLGSPLAVFLALRGVRPQGTGSMQHFLPPSACRRLFNIFHPSDPVAYRLEPLVLKHYSTIKPLPIHYHNSARWPNYNNMPRVAYAAFPEPEPEEKKEEALVESNSNDSLVASTSDKAPPPSNGASSGFGFAKWFSELKAKRDKEMHSAELRMLQNMDLEAERLQSNLHYPEPQDIDKTEMEWRLDYQLKQRSMESSYFSLLTSHTSYWTNKDIALFVLTHLFPQLQEGSSV